MKETYQITTMKFNAKEENDGGVGADEGLLLLDCN
jgi:hypothetical protein